MNIQTDETRGIEAQEEEGLVETTHFIIDYSGEQKKLAIEYNMFGARMGDFVKYIQNIGINKQALSNVGFLPIVLDIFHKARTMKTQLNETGQHFGHLDLL